MSEKNPDSAPGENRDDRGEVAWNEFDWERYLREQDNAVHRYLGFYEACRHSPDRIDDVAELMEWGAARDDDDDADEPQDEIFEADSHDDDAEADEPEDFTDDDEVYTLHKNPVFVATKALFLSLRRTWELLAVDPHAVPQPVAVALLAALHRGEEHATQAVAALDFGDYAMAVSLFKRAFAAHNATLALLNGETFAQHRAAAAWREEAMPKLFDLREIWLRVAAECRAEVDRSASDN